MNDFTNYMRCDPLFRKNNYGELTFSMLYAYSEDFVLVFSHDEVVHGKGSMIGKMPGETLEKKAENLRAAYAFMTVSYTHLDVYKRQAYDDCQLCLVIQIRHNIPVAGDSCPGIRGPVHPLGKIDGIGSFPVKCFLLKSG